MMNFVTSIIKKYIENELSDDTEDQMLEPCCSSKKENGFSEPELVPKKDECTSTEYTIPASKARFSLLQEFDPLCAESETFSDAKSFSETGIFEELDETETKTEALNTCVSADLSESCITLTASMSSDEYITVPAEKNIKEVDYGPSTSSGISRQVEYNQSIDSDSEIDSLKLVAIGSMSSMTDAEAKKMNSDLTEKVEQLEQQLSDQKLECHTLNQERERLRTELKDKDEVIFQKEKELVKINVSHEQEIKRLKDELTDKSKVISKENSEDLLEELKECMARESKAIAELSEISEKCSSYEMTLAEFEEKNQKTLDYISKVVEEHKKTEQHLKNLELAFSDVHAKFERSKELIEGYVANEEALNKKFDLAMESNSRQEKRYESLKAHAKSQILNCNKEIQNLKTEGEKEIGRLNKCIKTMEIKCSSLEVFLNQKTVECEKLAALCEETAGLKK